MGVTAKLCSSAHRCLTPGAGSGAAYFISQAKRWGTVGFKIFMRILGPVMLFLALSLITAILFCLLFYVVPDITEGDMFLFGLHFCGGMFLLVNVVFNYIACAFTPPGAPVACNDPAGILGDRVVVIDGKKVRQIRHAIVLAPAVSYRYCRHCRCIKPPRAHHDSISGKCVLVMDHYCPWMNNCVGLNNYRHFVLFLLYLAVGCVYVLFVTTGYFSSPFPYQRPVGGTPQQQQQLQLQQSALTVSVNTAIMFSYTVGLSALVSVALLGSWHCYLCLTNQTTIEFYINMEERSDARQRGAVFRNPFDKGWRKNLVRVFGDVGWLQALAISLRKPVAEEWPPLPTRDMVAGLASAMVV